MKPNSDYHFNQMPDNEPFRRGLGYMISLKIEEYHELLACKEKVEALAEEIETLKALVRKRALRSASEKQ